MRDCSFDSESENLTRKEKIGKFYACGVCTIHTSLAVTFNASQSILGRTLHKKEGLYSMSDCSSSASLKWRGKERGEVLHALTAQVRKFTVRIFIFEFMYSRGSEGNAGLKFI